MSSESRSVRVSMRLKLTDRFGSPCPEADVECIHDSHSNRDDQPAQDKIIIWTDLVHQESATI